MTQPALRPRIPVYLLTGHLGSGKTTLLAFWLRGPELAQSALIINEIGEVGLDQHMLYGATDTAALVANACICCTGLPGLESALAELFWARLERKIKPFLSVVVETTGLADPAPILELFQTDSLLRERYQIAGVVTTLSATAGRSTLARHPEASSQIKAADLIVLTKTDVASDVEQDALLVIANALNPHAKLAKSGKASLSASAMLAWLSAKARPIAEQAHVSIAPSGGQEGVHRHSHNAESFFIALPELERRVLQRLLERWITQSYPVLWRLKGVVGLTDGSLVVVQWTAGDRQAALEPFEVVINAAHILRKGLTVIVEAGFDALHVFSADDI